MQLQRTKQGPVGRIFQEAGWYPKGRSISDIRAGVEASRVQRLGWSLWATVKMKDCGSYLGLCPDSHFSGVWKNELTLPSLCKMVTAVPNTEQCYFII